jgi:hypothetical protein
MKIRTFWTILLKIIGIFLVLRGVSTIVHSLNTTIAMLSYGDGAEDIIWISLATIAMVVVIYFFVLWLFVFKTSWLINKLHLDKGFDEEKINLNIQSSAVLTIAIIVIGGLMFVDGLPQLCKEIFMFFQQKSVFRASPSSGWIILHLIKTVLGYLLMTNSKPIVAFIEKRTKENE